MILDHNRYKPSTIIFGGGNGYEMFFANPLYVAMAIRLFQSSQARNFDLKHLVEIGFGNAHHALLVVKMEGGYIFYQSFMGKYTLCDWMTGGSETTAEASNCIENYGLGKVVSEKVVRHFFHQVVRLVNFSNTRTCPTTIRIIAKELFGVETPPMDDVIWTCYRPELPCS